MQMKGGDILGGSRIPLPCDLYCAIDAQVCAASLTFVRLHQISREAAAFFPEKQRCSPAEQPGRGAGLWHGGQPIDPPGTVSFGAGASSR